MKNWIILFCALTIFGADIMTGQENAEAINDYKYILIPLQFSFQEEENEYLLSSRLKHLFDSHGFSTVIDQSDAYPNDLKVNSCLGLVADVKSESEGLFAMQTKLKISLKNCRREVIMESETGVSRAKDFEEGYREALADAFKSFENVDHAYNGEEVKKDRPKTTDQEVAEKTEITVESEPENALDQTLDKVYTSGEATYGVRKIQAGYLLLNETTGDRVALLNQTESSILYSSDAVNGTASIKEKGNIIEIDYFDQSSGEVKKIVYKAE